MIERKVGEWEVRSIPGGAYTSGNGDPGRTLVHHEGRIYSLAEWEAKQREERHEGQLERIEALLERIAAALETRAT